VSVHFVHGTSDKQCNPDCERRDCACRLPGCSTRILKADEDKDDSCDNEEKTGKIEFPNDFTNRSPFRRIEVK
jgi:hypothetical protein